MTREPIIKNKYNITPKDFSRFEINQDRFYDYKNPKSESLSLWSETSMGTEMSIVINPHSTSKVIVKFKYYDYDDKYWFEYIPNRFYETDKIGIRNLLVQEACMFYLNKLIDNEIISLRRIKKVLPEDEYVFVYGEHVYGAKDSEWHESETRTWIGKKESNYEKGDTVIVSIAEGEMIGKVTSVVTADRWFFHYPVVRKFYW